MVQVSPSRDLDKFMLRFPNGMRDRVRLEAEHNRRSMNSEIIYQLGQIYGSAEAVAGERFGDTTPATAGSTAAMHGSHHING